MARSKPEKGSECLEISAESEKHTVVVKEQGWVEYITESEKHTVEGRGAGNGSINRGESVFRSLSFS